MQISDDKGKPRLIAFYLPQFHTIPENDSWWGKGFTEWTNVTKASPKFKGHYQPHLPADLGFYDLRLPEVREEQAKLAKKYNIFGFCYYHYWFNGKRLLERPFEEVFNSGKPDFPFCLCWANENWTKVWDGGNDQVLMKQDYCHKDDLSHIESLIPAFKDERHIRIDDKPVFLVYRTELLPDPRRTAEIWKESAIKAGLKGLYLIRVEGFKDRIKPEDIGFDAATEFAPDWKNRGPLIKNGVLNRLFTKFGFGQKVFTENNISDYSNLAKQMLSKSKPGYKRFRCVTPSWDNTARRKKGAAIFLNSSPEKYQNWLSATLQETDEIFQNDEKIIFINAWNEWAEGNHLEPCQKWGTEYLEATLRAIKSHL